MRTYKPRKSSRDGSYLLSTTVEESKNHVRLTSEWLRSSAALGYMPTARGGAGKSGFHSESGQTGSFSPIIPHTNLPFFPVRSMLLTGNNGEGPRQIV